MKWLIIGGCLFAILMVIGLFVPEPPKSKSEKPSSWDEFMGRRGVYTGPPSTCPSCGSKDIIIGGGYEDGNIPTEDVSCKKCGYYDSYSIA